MIYVECDFQDFVQQFEAYGRGSQFSRAALETLFDWLSEPEGNYRLDVIELCCEWAEYDDAELLEDFGHLTDSGSRSVGELLEALLRRRLAGARLLAPRLGTPINAASPSLVFLARSSSTALSVASSDMR